MWWHHTGTISDRLEVMFLFSWLLVSPACMCLGYSYAELEQGALEYIKKRHECSLVESIGRRDHQYLDRGKN